MASRQARTTCTALSVVVGLMTCAAAGFAQSTASPTFPPAPQGFDTRHTGTAAGRVERIEYPSTVTGAKRRAVVYTPPGYSTARKYPVLYLLHGIGGSETHWTQFGAADSILDNLIADGKAVPMIVVMPNGRASNEPSTLFAGRGGRRGDGRGAAPAADGAAANQGRGANAAAPAGGGNRGGAAMGVEFQAYAAFERELIADLIPYVESNYSAQVGREHRALAGLSMGGGQSLNFGLANLNTFAWVGGFSSAPNTLLPAQLVKDPAAARQQLNLLWVSCGDQDSLFNISEGVHRYLAEQSVPHIWHIDVGGAHTFRCGRTTCITSPRCCFDVESPAVHRHAAADATARLTHRRGERSIGMAFVKSRSIVVALLTNAAVCHLGAAPQAQTTTAPSSLKRLAADVVITAADCTAAKLGASVGRSSIGAPIGDVTLGAPSWVAAAGGAPAHCRVNGAIAPVDTVGTARPINFGVALPATWSHRGAQIGGGGMNGVVPNLTAGGGPAGASLLARGFATYGSDSGHQASFGPAGRRGGEPPAGNAAPAAGRGVEQPSQGDAPRGRGALSGPNPANDWALNEEAIANLGHLQMKKTHDVAMVLIERLYGARPRFNYYIGSSQGGREALTVAQRYPADYDGISATVPIVGFSSLMLAPELIRIHEKPLANWVTPAKVNAIRGEFMRQCDTLDGLADGIINNYMACRAIFDVTPQRTASSRSGRPGSHNGNPWAAKRCPNNVDPNPADTSAGACLTDGQISTLQVTYSRYRFATPLAHGARTFGMWVPNTDPSGSGLILPTRFRGQEGAAADAPMHSHLGVLGVVGFLMKDLSANPLDYVEGGSVNQRREELSAVLDSTNPDLSAFARRGGKMIVTIGTNDTLASPGAQLDYFQSVIDRMGRQAIDRFARFFVMPQTGHGLSGTNYGVDGTGRTIPSGPIPNRYDQLGLLFEWVENSAAPAMSVTVTAGEKSLPLCSYPNYPRYRGGAPDASTSYRCAR